MMRKGHIYQSFRPGTKNLSLHGLAIKTLKKHKRPMKVWEIMDEIRKVRRFKGKTPENSLSSILQRSCFVKRTNAGYKLIKNP